MNLWNKTIQSLISSGSEECLILAYLLIEDTISLHYYWYLGDPKRKELELPCYVHIDPLLEIMEKFHRLSVEAHDRCYPYLKDLKTKLDASVE